MKSALMRQISNKGIGSMLTDRHENRVIKLLAPEQIATDRTHGNVRSTLDDNIFDVRLRLSIDNSRRLISQGIQIDHDFLLRVHLWGWLVAPGVC